MSAAVECAVCLQLGLGLGLSVLYVCSYILQRIDWQSLQVQQRQADWQLVFRELIDCSEELGQYTLAMIGDPDVQLVADGVLEAMAEVGLSASSMAQAANPDRRSVRCVVDCTGSTVIKGSIDQADDENVLVVASWLAVKEMSMLLAQMVALVPLVVSRPLVSVVLIGVVQEEQQGAILGAAEVSRVADIFIHLLLSTKHNGAVEKAQLAFSALCERLLSSGATELYQLPTQWLTSLLRLVNSTKLQTLRRSAGLPYAVVAILKAENALMPCGLVAHAFSALLTIARDPTVEPEAKVHGLNVIKAIANESSLKVDVGGFVCEALILSIEGFKATSWGERNSSQQAYAALLKRALGLRSDGFIQQTRGTTAADFFSRFPELEQFMHRELEADDVTASSTLYPVLLLISSFQPAVDPLKCAAAERLEQLVHAVGCSAPSLQIRHVAARAMAPLVAVGQRGQVLRRLIESIPALTKQSNCLHGVLLQVLLLQLNVG